MLKLDTRGLSRSLLMAGFAFIVVAAVLATRPAEPPRAAEIQFGLASYYGPGFHGDETASGEIFNQWSMVAAHRTLPLGSVVRVTNLENGRQVVLRVIDRGPYGKNHRKGTIIDVSRGAAGKLRFVRDGLTHVRVDVLRRGNNRRSVRR
jgi:peptidoglycan lytic transglycosylase